MKVKFSKTMLSEEKENFVDMLSFVPRIDGLDDEMENIRDDFCRVATSNEIKLLQLVLVLLDEQL